MIGGRKRRRKGSKGLGEKPDIYIQRICVLFATLLKTVSPKTLRNSDIFWSSSVCEWCHFLGLGSVDVVSQIRQSAVITHSLFVSSSREFVSGQTLVCFPTYVIIEPYCHGNGGSAFMARRSNIQCLLSDIKGILLLQDPI